MDENTVADKTSLDTIVQVILRNDVTAYQGVKSIGAFFKILPLLRRNNTHWTIYNSPPLQRLNASVPEHFGYIFRSDIVKLTTLNRYPDLGDHYERDPFSAVVETSGSEFVLTNIHLWHLDVPHELTLLPDTFQNIAHYYSNKHVLMAGDFNAGPPFLTKQQYDAAAVTVSSDFDWTIDWNQDSWTFKNRSSSYARFLVGSKELLGGITSSKVVDFIQEYSLTEEQALAISWLMPIEMELNEAFAIVG